MRKILVLGVGNILLTDDGVGVWAAQKLMEESWPEGVMIMDGGTFTQDIFHLLEGYDELLVLDVVHAGLEPGSCFILSEEDLVQKESQRLSLHDIDLLDSLRMAERLGKRPVMRVLGMEPYDISSWNIKLSPVCQAAFSGYLELARKEIVRLLQKGGAF